MGDGVRPEPADAEASLRHLLDIASSGEWYARIDLADTEKLPPEVYRALVDDEAAEVIVLLARNHSTPREVLDELASRGTQLSEVVDLNPNASPMNKERVPIWKHTQVSLERYFEELALTPAVRSEILDAWMAHSPATLGTLRRAAEQNLT